MVTDLEENLGQKQEGNPKTERKLRVVHVVSDLGLGGVQIIATQKLIDFKKLGHEVAISTYSEGFASKFLEDANIHIEYCKDKDYLSKFIVDFKTDIIQGHSCGGGCDAIEVGKQLNICCGEMIHSTVSGNKQGNFEVVHTNLVHSMRPDSTLIYWGFNTDRINPTMSRQEARNRWEIPNDVYVIGRNSRLDGSKSPMDFISTLRYLPEWVWGIIGGWGPEADNLQRLASALGIRRRLVFTGAQYDVGNIFAATDCIVYPTTDESFCAGTCEPLYQMKPVVCYLRGGMGEYLIHEKTALVGNNPQELAQLVLRLINDTSLAAELGKNGYNKCKDLGFWDPIRDAQEHLDLYERTLNNRSR